MDFSVADLVRTEAQLSDTERRRAWMDDIAARLAARGHVSQAAERQAAQFAAMSASLRKLRDEIEAAVLAARGDGPADRDGTERASS